VFIAMLIDVFLPWYNDAILLLIGVFLLKSGKNVRRAVDRVKMAICFWSKECVKRD